MKNGKNIDVFYYLEEVMMKKDLDDNKWYQRRTDKLVANMATSLRQEIIDWIETGESVSKKTAEKAVDRFIAETRGEVKV